MAAPSSESVKRMLRTRGALAAVATAGGVGVWLVVQYLLQNAISYISYLSTPGLSDLVRVQDYFWPSLAQQVFLYALPIALGFFLSLWLVAPISELLGLGHVITRAVLATGIASTVYFIIRSLWDIIAALVPDRPFFSNSAPVYQIDGPGILATVGADLQGALVTFVVILPLGVLAGILLWHWRKAHPPVFHVSGLIDV